MCVKDMLLEEIKKEEYQFLREEKNRCMMITVLGSNAFGTMLEGRGDVDVRGIRYDKKDELIGMSDRRHTYDDAVLGKTDTMLFNWTHYCKQVLRGNINMVEVLGNKKEDYITDEIGEIVLNNKRVFYSKDIVKSIQRFTKASMDDIERKIMRQDSCKIEKVWSTMAHIVREQYVGMDLLRTGELINYRKEREELKEIKKGLYGRDIGEFKRYVEKLVLGLAEEMRKSKLRDNADYEEVNKLCMNVNMLVLGREEKVFE